MTKLLGVPSPDGIAKDGAYMLLQSLLDEPHCCTPKWYFSRQEIDNHSPSRKDGINLKKEMQLRMLYCSFLKDLGIRIQVPQKTIATAIMLCHRFYLRQSHRKNEWQTIATASMFLACKMEETVYSLERFIVVAYELMYMSDPTASQRIRKKEVFEKQKELILTGENLLLVTIAFDFNIQHPYVPLVAALKKLKLLSDTELRKMAWNFVNDSLRTTLCLQYKPHYIAAGSMYLAAKAFKLKLPSGKGKAWWMEFDVSPQQLEEVIQQMILQLGLNKGSVTPSVPEKVTQATVVKEKAASITNDQLKSKDTNLNVNHTHSQCHKSDSGSPDSVVEDAERSDEGGVQARVIEFKEAGGCKIVSVSVGLSKIEKDRIKETMKRRRCDRATSKVTVAMDDDQDSDAWIARELEKGIDLGPKFAEKRHKCDL